MRRPGWGDYRLYRTLPVEGRLGYDEKPDWRVISPALGALEELTRGPKARRASPGASTSARWARTTPSTCREPFVDRYDLGDVPLPASYHDRCEDKPRVYQRMRRQYWDQLSEDEIRDAVRHYWAYCTMEDAYLGLFLDALDASGQREDTLVLRLSDHGEYAGAHGLFCKGVPAFREGYHVPCIASWPAGIDRPGREEGAFVTLADIAPTLLEVAGAPVPEGLTGRSLTPFLEGQRPPGWRDAFYSQMNGVELYYTQRAVQTDEWKYVYNGFDFDELYHLPRRPARDDQPGRAAGVRRGQAGPGAPDVALRRGDGRPHLQRLRHRGPGPLGPEGRPVALSGEARRRLAGWRRACGF